MTKGTVLILDENEELDLDGDVMAFYTRTEVYQADLVIRGDKVIKNRWGRNGTIVDTGFEHLADQNIRIRLLLDIWNEMMKQKGAIV